MAMYAPVNYNLEEDEFVLMKDEMVTFTGSIACRASEVLITNKNIVCDCYISSNKHYVQKFPISTVKVYQGVPQMSISGDTLSPKLDIYFTNATVSLYFGNFIRPKKAREHMQKWIDVITSAIIKGNDAVSSISSALSADNSSEVIYCDQCGMKLTKGARFCTGCGISIDNKRFTKEQQEILLLNLKNLFNAGVISNDEFEVKKEYILG